MATDVVSDAQAEESLAWLENNINACVKARADYDHLEEFSKTVLAELVMKECTGMSVKASESYSRAHDKYRNHRRAVDAANRDRLRLDYLRRFHELRLDLWRTSCANSRRIA